MNALIGGTRYCFLLVLLVNFLNVSFTLRCYSSEQDSSVLCDDDEAVCLTVCIKCVTIQGCSWRSCETLISTFPHISDCKHCTGDNCNIAACVDGKVGTSPENTDKHYIRVKNLTRYRLVWPDPAGCNNTLSPGLKPETEEHKTQPRIRYTLDWFQSTQLGTTNNPRVVPTSTMAINMTAATRNNGPMFVVGTTSPVEKSNPKVGSRGDKGKTSSKSLPDSGVIAPKSEPEASNRQEGSGTKVNDLEKILTVLLLLTLLLICVLSSCWICCHRWLCKCEYPHYLNNNSLISENYCNLIDINSDLGCDYPCKAFDRIEIDDLVERSGRSDKSSTCTCKRKPKISQSTNESKKKIYPARKCRAKPQSCRGGGKVKSHVRKQNKVLESHDPTKTTNTTHQEEVQVVQNEKRLCKHDNAAYKCKKRGEISKTCGQSEAFKSWNQENDKVIKDEKRYCKNNDMEEKDKHLKWHKDKNSSKNSLKQQVQARKTKKRCATILPQQNNSKNVCNEQIEEYDSSLIETELSVGNICKDNNQIEEDKTIVEICRKKIANKMKVCHKKWKYGNLNKGDHTNECCCCTVVSREDARTPPKKHIQSKALIESVDDAKSAVYRTSGRLNTNDNVGRSFISSESYPSSRADVSERAVVPLQRTSSNLRQILPNLAGNSSVRYLLVPGYYVQGLSMTALQMIMSKYQTFRDRSTTYQNPPRSNYPNHEKTSYRRPQSVYLVPGRRMDPPSLGSAWQTDPILDPTMRDPKKFMKGDKKLELK